MHTNRLGFWFLIAIICSPAGQTCGDEALEVAAVEHTGPVDFEKEILPILRRNCLACHSSTNPESELILETPQTILKGGSEGPAAVAGKSADSLIFQTAAHIEGSFMPPDDNEVDARNLTPQELGLLKLWIDQGATGEVLGIAAAPQWQPLPLRVNPIYAVAMAPHGDYLAASRANQIFMYHVPGKLLIGRLTDPEMIKSATYDKPGVAHFDLVQSLAFSPDGQWLASGGYRTVKLWKRQDGVRTAELPKAEGEIRAIARSDDGSMLAVAEENGKIKLIDLASGNRTQTLAGHAGAVHGIRFSTDASQLVSGGADNTYRIWNTADGKQVTSGATPSPVTAVAFAANDKQVVTAEEDNVIRTWSIEANEGDAAENDAPQPLKELKGHTASITDLAAIPGTTHIVSAGLDASVRRWDVNGGNMIRQFAHGGPVVAIALHPAGKRIASVSDNGTAKLWDADNGQQIAELDDTTSLKHKVNRETLAVAVGARRVANAKQDIDEANKRKKLEEDNAKKATEAVNKSEEDLKQKTEAAKKPEEEKLAAEQALKEAEPKVAPAEAAAKQAGDELKAAEEALKKAQADAGSAADEDAKAKAQQAVEEANTKLKTAQEAKKKADEALKVAQQALKQAQDNQKNKTNAAQKPIDARNAAQRALEAAKRSVIRSGELVTAAAEAIPGYEAAHKQEQEAHQQLQMAQQAAQQELADAAAAQRQPVRAVAFSPDGSLLAIASDDALIRTFSGETGQAIATITNEAPVIGLAFAEGGLIAAGSNKSLVVWDPQPTWQLARTIGAHDKPDQLVDRVTSLHFSPDSKMLASGGGEPSRGGELKIWNVENGSLIRHFSDAHSDAILGLEFSPDTRHLASCGADRFMKVFEISTGELVRSFEGHTSSVLGVSWRADGRVLATCGADNAVKVWDFGSGELTKTIQGFNKEVTSVEFMGSSDNMMCSSGDKQISAKNVGGGNVRNYGGPTDFMYTVRSSADGKVIAAGGQDSIVRVWNENGQSIINFQPPQPASDPNQQASN